jgi:RND family efflux transporter MFP subunit
MIFKFFTLIALNLIVINSSFSHTVIGILEGKREIIIKTRSQGELESIFISEGDYIEAGTVLGELNSEKEIIEQEMAQTDFEFSEVEYQKSLKLAQFISKDELIKKRNDFKKKKNLKKLKDYYLKTKKIVSPISGTITRKYIKVGESLSNGAKAFEVIQFEELIIDLYIHGKYAFELQKGANLDFTNELKKEQIFQGKVIFIGPVLDKASGTVHVKLSLKNPRLENGEFLLTPGTTVRVKIN